MAVLTAATEIAAAIEAVMVEQGAARASSVAPAAKSVAFASTFDPIQMICIPIWVDWHLIVVELHLVSVE